MGNSFRNHFEDVHVYLWKTSQKWNLGPRVCTLVILTDPAKSPSVEFVLTHTPTGNVQQCPFPHSLNNQVCYNERFLIFIEQIYRIRELLKSKRSLLYT